MVSARLVQAAKLRISASSSPSADYYSEPVPLGGDRAEHVDLDETS